MRNWSQAVFGAVFLFGLSADAGTTMRCGRELVSLGDSRYEVRSSCGEPDDRQTRVEYRSVRHRVSVSCGTAQQPKRCSTVRSREVEIVIEHWLYDFGRREFMQHLIFEQGKLVRVYRGERGGKD